MSAQDLTTLLHGTQKKHTRHRNEFSPSGKDFCYQLCGRLWRDGRTFDKQLPLDILFEDLLEGGEHGVLIAEARPDNVGLCDSLVQGCDNNAVRDVGMVRLGVGGGARPQHNRLFEIAFGGEVIAYGLGGDFRGCHEVKDWGKIGTLPMLPRPSHARVGAIIAGGILVDTSVM